MPVTAKLSSNFYEKFGDEATNELVEWFNQVDAAYRSDLRDFNEINFGRFDSRLTERLALSDARLGRRLAEFERRLEARLEAKLEARLVPIEERLLAVEASLVELDRKMKRGHFPCAPRPPRPRPRWSAGCSPSGSRPSV